MNNVFIALGGIFIGFSLSLLFYRSITLRMTKNIIGISEWYIIPGLKEMRNTMQMLHNVGAKDYSAEIKRVDDFIARYEELNRSGKKLI